MIVIDYRDTRPLYEQVVDRLEKLILRGGLAPDDKLPSVRNLAVDLSINPNTIQRAYSVLEQKGLIYTVKGRGNFVAPADVLRRTHHAELANQVRDLVRQARETGLEEEEVLFIVREVYEQ